MLGEVDAISVSACVSSVELCGLVGAVSKIHVSFNNLSLWTKIECWIVICCTLETVCLLCGLGTHSGTWHRVNIDVERVSEVKTAKILNMWVKWKLLRCWTCGWIVCLWYVRWLLSLFPSLKLWCMLAFSICCKHLFFFGHPKKRENTEGKKWKNSLIRIEELGWRKTQKWRTRRTPS